MGNLDGGRRRLWRRRQIQKCGRRRVDGSGEKGAEIKSEGWKWELRQNRKDGREGKWLSGTGVRTEWVRRLREALALGIYKAHTPRCVGEGMTLVTSSTFAERRERE